MQRRYASLGHAPPGAGGPHPSGHIPGVYPPASLANDLVARERERLERLGIVLSACYHEVTVYFYIQLVIKYNVEWILCQILEILHHTSSCAKE